MANLHARTDIAYGEHPRQRFDLFCPQDVRESRPLVVCVHGGWWQSGWREDLLVLALRLAEAGWPAATIGYRLLESTGDGAGIQADLRAAVTTALEENLVLGGTGRSVVLVGAGAGGLTALGLAAASAGDHEVLVQGVACYGTAPSLQAWDGCTSEVAKQLAIYAGDKAQDLDPSLQAADRFPPVLLVHGDADKEVPVGPGREFYRKLIEADDPAKLQVLAGVGHHALDAAHGRGFTDCVDRICDWLRELQRG